MGPGTTQQMVGEMLRLEAGIDWVYAPFAGGAPAVTALLGGHVSAVIGNYSEVSQQIGAGKLRALAVGSRERLEVLNGVPTLVELGYTTIDGAIWFGFVAPAGTPPPVVARLQADIARALKEPALREKLVAQYLYPVDGAQDAFGPFLAEQLAKYARFIRQTGLKVN